MEGEGEPRATVAAMARAYLEELVAFYPEGPVYLGGWSFGGVVAMEMAQLLQQKGRVVDALVMIESQLGGAAAPMEEKRLLHNFIVDLGIPIASDNYGRIDSLEEALSLIREQAKAHLRQPPDISHARIGDYFRVYKANWIALRQYSPKPYSGKTLLLVTPHFSEEAIATWSRLSANQIQAVKVSGNHYSVMEKPHIEEAAARIDSFLDIGEARPDS